MLRGRSGAALPSAHPNSGDTWAAQSAASAGRQREAGRAEEVQRGAGALAAASEVGARTRRASGCDFSAHWRCHRDCFLVLLRVLV